MQRAEEKNSDTEQPTSRPTGFPTYTNSQAPDYFRNNGRFECFRCALANLLLELGDAETADRVYRQFWNHELTRNGLCSLFLLTRYVSDLSEGVYDGRLNLFIEAERMTRIISSFPAPKLEAVRAEIAQDRLRQAPNFDLPPMSIAVVARTTSHAMTYLGEGRYIDDGKLIRYATERLRLIAVLQISRATETVRRFNVA